jgi:hypothetical protein
MAIKGKGKTKSRSVARAPKRGPVPVPVPFVRKRWVQVTAAVIVGFLAFWLLTWVIDGLRANDDEARRAEQRTVLEEWQAQVESDLADVGQFRDPAPPVIVPQVRATADRITKGRPADLEPADLEEIASQLEDAATAIASYPLADRVRDMGFGLTADQVLSTKTEFEVALGVYRQATLLAAAAAAAEAEDPEVAESLATRAVEVFDQAEALMREAHRKYTLALGAAGIVLADPAAGGGLPLG